MRRVLPISVVAAALIATAVPASAQGQGDGARQGREGGAPGGGGGRQGGGAGGGGRQGGGPPAAPTAIKPVTESLYVLTVLGVNTTLRVDLFFKDTATTENLGEQNYNQLMDLVKTVSQ